MISKKPLLIVCSDVHLSEKAPLIRSIEPDWFDAQRRQLRWLREMQSKYNIPVVIAGDVFDRAVVSSKLINFAIDELPNAYAIPGNHDLPYHSMEQISASAYGTLVRSGKIMDLSSGNCTILKVDGVSIALHPFPFGAEVKPLAEKQGDIDIAVVHEYLWQKTGDNYVNQQISPDGDVESMLRRMPGYDYYVYGDNHIGFVAGNVINCGTFFVRHRPDTERTPIIGLLYRDGIQAVHVPSDDDIYTVEERIKSDKREHDFSAFYEMLGETDNISCDVDDILDEYMRTHDISDDVRKAIQEITYVAK